MAARRSVTLAAPRDSNRNAAQQTIGRERKPIGRCANAFGMRGEKSTRPVRTSVKSNAPASRACLRSIDGFEAQRTNAGATRIAPVLSPTHQLNQICQGAEPDESPP